MALNQTLVEALDAAHAHGASLGANLSETRVLLLDAFSLPRLRVLEAAHAHQYRRADPFPHMVLDGLLPDRVLRAVVAELPEAYNKNGCVRGAKFCISRKISGGTLVQPERDRLGQYVAIARRSEINAEKGMSPHTLMVFRAMKSNEFRAFLGRLSGVSPLRNDPFYSGAGVHFAAPGAKLNLHADFNMVNGLHRRVNTFLYLNDDWSEAYGGHLQLWDRNLSRCAQRILPIWNRFVAFSSGDFTFHGHPMPLACPAHRMRRALVLYFYAETRPPNECACRHRATRVCPQDCNKPHNTLWVTPGKCTACEDAACARYPSGPGVEKEYVHATGLAVRGATKRMSAIGFGTCCRKSATGPPLIASTKQYLAQGGRMIDTAQLYRNHVDLRVAIEESGVPREQIWILSKLNTRPDKDAIKSYADAERAINDTLRELGLEYIDALLIHGAWKNTASQREEVWRALIDAQRASRVRAIGVSNYDREQIKLLEAGTRVRPAINELEYHPWVPNSTHELVEWCKAQDIAVVAYGSLGSAKLKKNRMRGSVPAIAAAANATSAQVLLRWALEVGVAVIPGATSAQHIRENLAAGGFHLTTDLRQQLLRLRGSARPGSFRRWLNLGYSPKSST